MTQHAAEALAVVTLLWLGVLTFGWAANRQETRALRGELATLRAQLDLPSLRREADSWTQKTDEQVTRSAAAACEPHDGGPPGAAEARWYGVRHGAG